MAGVITTGNHPKALWPGIHAWFGLKYNEFAEQYSMIFDVEKSKKNYEEDVLGTGFGLAPAKSEGGAVSYDSESQGYTKRYTHAAYALGYIVTREEMDDNQYEVLSKRRAKRLAFSMRQTKEVVHALILDRATNSSYTGGDAKELLATDHPTVSGNQSNELATAADFSEAALEDIIIQIGQAKNDRGMRINLRPRKLIHPVNLQFDVARVLKSELTPDSANNAVNAVRMVGLKPVLNNYLTDTDQWFVQTDCPNGMTSFDRVSVELAQDNDFDTDNAKAKAYMRFVAGWTDWRSMYGSPGA